jgi:thioredoxin 1
MTDSGFGKELETIRKRRLEELTMSADKQWPSAPVNVTDSDFQEFVKKYPRAIIDCWAPWCGPCRMLGPVIDELAGAYKGKVAFGKLNTDESQATAMSFGIQSIPTLLFFRDGKLVDRTMGAMPRQALEPKIKAFLG